MAGIRMTGLASGMDTQSLISELTNAYQKKVDNTKKAQTKAEWKKAAWSDLNTKLTNFYKGTLSTFKTTGTYKAKAVNGTFSGVKITAGNSAVNGNHTVQVKSTASAQMWTGKKINSGTVTATTYTAAESTTKLSDLTDSQGNSILNSLNGAELKIENSDGSSREVTLNLTSLSANATVSDLTDYVNAQISGTGIEVSYADGKFTFSNSNSDNVTVKASNTNAKSFGITEEGLSVSAASDTGENGTISGSAFAYKVTQTDGSAISGSTKLSDMGITATSISINGESITIDRNTTLSGLAASMAEKGINANYDAAQGRFYLSSKNTGTDNAFTIDADNDTLEKLGLKFDIARLDGESDDEFAARKKSEGIIDATDASIIYNGIEYNSTTNNFNINGLTFDVTSKGEEMQFSVDNDVDSIYNKVKDFLKEYNSLLKEMTDLYGAESSRGYEPLTSEEKDAMSEDEVKEYEKKIKDSLLRRDDRLSSYTSNFRSIMNKSVDVDGVRYSLSSFGINTGAWSEKGLLHLDGDADDATTSGNEDRLKAAIASNPEAVTKTMASLGNELYSYLMKAQAKTTTSSSQTFYDDLTLDADIKTQKENVKKMQQKMNDEEDKYYKQFSAMETAMAKLQSQQSYLSGLFGGMS